MDYYYDDDDDDDDDDYYLPFQIPWWATPPMAVPRMVSPRGVVPPWKRTPPPIRLWGESNRDTVFEHDLVKDIQTVKSTLSRIEESAQESIITKDYLSALWKYRCAVSLCSQEHLLEAFPFMHAKCAEVALLLNVKDENEKVDGLMYAYKEADLCIRLYAKTLSTSAKDTAKTNQLVSTVYFARAEAVKRLILMGQVDFVPSTTPVVDAINDYCKCFAMNPEKVEALVDAILIAVDNGATDHLPLLSEEQILKGLVMEVVNSMVINVGRLKLQPQHFEVFIFNMVPHNASLTGNTVNLSTLVKAGIAKADTLNRMMQIGMKFKIKDLKDFLHKYDEDNCTKILTHCSLDNAQLKVAVDAAIRDKKYNLLAYLIKRGTTPDVAKIIKIVDLSLKIDPVILSYVLANGLTKNIASFLVRTLNRVKEGQQFNSSKQENTEHQNTLALLQNTIKCSRTICGYDAASGMRVVIAELLNATVVHTEVICLLLQCGANSTDLCQVQFQKATPLHAATALALTSGSTSIISAAAKCSDFELPQDGRVIDDNGDCPYHLVVKSNSDDDIKLKVGIALSELHPPLDPTVKDTAGKNKTSKQAKQYVGESSEMFKCLIAAELKFALVHVLSESALSGILPELKKARDIWECVGIMENASLFKETIQALEMVGMREIAIKQALKYEKNDTNMANLSAECLAHKYARLYSTQKDVALLETYLGYIPDHIAKAKYWKRCGQYEKAIEVYVENKELESAFRLMSYLGWYDRGLELARKEGNKKWIVSFAVEGAKASLHDHGVLDTSILECLHGLFRDTELRCHNKLLPIINLLVGCGDGKAELIIKAAKMFEEQGNIIGELECCIQLLHLLKDNTSNSNSCNVEILRACSIAQQHAKMLTQLVALDNAKAVSLQHIFWQALIFYGFQPSGDGYYLHPKQSVWAVDLKQYKVEDSVDVDGVVRLNVTKTKQFLVDQLDRLSKEILILKEDAVKRKLQSDLCDICNTQFSKLLKDCLMLNNSTLIELHTDELKQFVSVHVNWLEYCSTAQLSADGPLCQLLNLFSPNVSPHLPSGLLHLKLMRLSPLVCNCIFNWLLRTLDSMATEEEYRADVWLMLWKASCIVGKGGGELRTLVKGLSEKVDDNDVVPVPYLLLDSSYIHQFDFWLEACDLICNKGEVITAAEYVIKYFLSHIAITSKRGSQIMVMNVVEILSIYCTALLCVIMRSQHKMGRRAPTFAMPSRYVHIIQMFDDLNTHGRGGYRLLEACVHQTDMWPEDSTKASLLLKHSLDLLLSVLKFSPKLPSSEPFFQCITLSLTILGNLAKHSLSDCAQLHEFIKVISEQHLQRYSHHITEIQSVLSAPDWSSNVFGLISSLETFSNPNVVTGITQIISDQCIKFVSYPHPTCNSAHLADSDMHISGPLDQLTDNVPPDHVLEPGLPFAFSETQDQHEGIINDGVWMVDTGHCHACSLHLGHSQMQQHIGTMEHQEKAQLFQTYHTMESECLQLQQRLLTAAEKFQSGVDRGKDFAKLIHEMEEEIEQNSSIFYSIRWQSSWESGIQELKQMKERMDMLCQCGVEKTAEK